jgi:hypothetical protein
LATYRARSGKSLDEDKTFLLLNETISLSFSAAEPLTTHGRHDATALEAGARFIWRPQDEQEYDEDTVLAGDERNAAATTTATTLLARLIIYCFQGREKPF